MELGGSVGNCLPLKFQEELSDKQLYNDLSLHPGNPRGIHWEERTEAVLSLPPR